MFVGAKAVDENDNFFGLIVAFDEAIEKFAA